MIDSNVFLCPSLSSDPGYSSTDALSEPTEFEYLRKVLFEYMMGRETKVGDPLALKSPKPTRSPVLQSQPKVSLYIFPHLEGGGGGAGAGGPPSHSESECFKPTSSLLKIDRSGEI